MQGAGRRALYVWEGKAQERAPYEQANGSSARTGQVGCFLEEWHELFQLPSAHLHVVGAGLDRTSWLHQQHDAGVADEL